MNSGGQRAHPSHGDAPGPTTSGCAADSRRPAEPGCTDGVRYAGAARPGCGDELATFLLPPAAYSSPSWYDSEQRTLFSTTWPLAGHDSELSSPDRRLSVLTGEGRFVVGRRVDGQLWAARSPNPRTDRLAAKQDDHSLDHRPVEARRDGAVACWEGLVWLNPAPQARPLEEWLRGVDAQLNGYELSRLAFAGRSRLEGRFNWKLFVENHIDVLHLWYLHAQTLPGAHQHFEWSLVGPHWVSYEPLEEGARRKPRFDRPISHVQGTRGPEGIGAHLLFPNIVFTTGRDSVQLTTLRPTSPESCELDTLTLCEPGAIPTATGEELRRRVPGGVLDEDMTACEGMQSAIRSSQLAVGPLARGHELPITVFHRQVLAHLAGSEAAPLRDDAASCPVS